MRRCAFPPALSKGINGTRPRRQRCLHLLRAIADRVSCFDGVVWRA
jgi:hypothetical protein